MCLVLRGRGGAGARCAPPKLTEAQKRQTKEHYEKATKYYNLGKYAEAVAEYQAAYLISADPVMLYNIAQCHRLNNQPDEAARFYKNYLRNAPSAAEPGRGRKEDRGDGAARRGASASGAERGAAPGPDDISRPCRRHEPRPGETSSGLRHRLACPPSVTPPEGSRGVRRSTPGGSVAAEPAAAADRRPAACCRCRS